MSDVQHIFKNIRKKILKNKLSKTANDGFCFGSSLVNHKFVYGCSGKPLQTPDNSGIKNWCYVDPGTTPNFNTVKDKFKKVGRRYYDTCTPKLMDIFNYYLNEWLENFLTYSQLRLN